MSPYSAERIAFKVWMWLAGLVIVGCIALAAMFLAKPDWAFKLIGL